MSTPTSTRSRAVTVIVGVISAVVVMFALAGLRARVWADPGVVVTRNGQSYEGDVRETEDEVIVTIRGIETVIPLRDVESIRYSGDFEEEFRQRLAELPATDVEARIELARTAFDQRRYDLAREALYDALDADPNSREATQMLELVERQIQLERAGPAQPATAPATRPSTATPTTPPPRPQRGDRQLLTPEQINVIRQKELKPTDFGVLVRIGADVKRQFAQQQNMTFAEFNRLSPVQQALMIIERGDEEMRGQVRITSDPPSLIEYKRDIQPLILGSCATSACHGSQAGGNFMLYAPADSDAVSYTNFYILTQYPGSSRDVDPDRFFGSAVRRLIERGRGEQSLLANYGLPVTIAEFDHPEIGGRPIPPLFRDKQDQRYRQLVDWMNRSLVRIEPEYNIDLPLPSADAAPPTAEPHEPATQPVETGQD